MRRHLSFACEGAALAATLDDAPGTTGLLIVSGGNEIRSGAHRGMAMLAQRIAAAGHPVFRFDRRGIGDSEGENRGFEASGPDIAAAIAAFRAAAPHLTRIVAFGNCDAASALLLHQPLPLDALILANPWTYDSGEDESDAPALPPAAAIRARYWARLKDPASLLRLLRGDIDIRKLFRGLSALLRPPQPAAAGSLVDQLIAGLVSTDRPVTFLLATGDRTAQAFAEAFDTALFALSRDGHAIGIARRASASHSFAGDDADWLAARIVEKLR